MLKSEAAAYLAGVTQTEGAEASAPTNLHVITGEVGEASADGKTLVKIDGLMFSESDDQFIEVDALGGLEEGDIATIVLTGEQGHAMTPLALGSIGSVDRITVRIAAIEADYIKVEQLDAAEARIGDLEADHVSVDDLNAATARIGTLETTRATITDLEAATARIGDLEADHVSTDDLNAATARIGTLEADHVSTDDLNAAKARIGTLETNTADIGTIRANSAKVQNLTAAELEADHATVGSLSTNYAHVTNGVIDNATIGYADVNNLSAHYAEIQNGKINSALIDTAAIVDEQVFTVTGNKATLAQIDASKINVLNLKAKDIEVERINGQPVTNKTLVDALSQHETDISDLDTKIDNEVEALNDRIDGAIETFTGTVVPTLDNTPASQWNTAKLKDQHVGDVYYVVNSQSAQNGYCYRFTKSGSTYSWQLIKDSDVTAALSRLQTAEGKIGDIEQFDVTVGSFMTDTEDEISSLKTKDAQLETSLGDKVSTSTFNTVSQKVDTNEANITSMSTVLTNNGLTSSTNITNTVNTVKQTADTNKASITNLTQTVNNKADGSTVTTLTNRVSTVEQNLSGITTRVSTTETNIANETALRKAGYATSTTAIGTAAKVATITPAVTDFALYSGCTITVRFDKGNTAANPTLNVNGTGAKKIVVNGTENPGADFVKWSAYQTCIFTYDGSYWRFVGSDGETVRLKSAETAIEQNAEAITLRATKAETTVGGRNLLSGDAAMVHKWTNVMPSAVTVTGEEYEALYHMIKGVGGWENVYSPAIHVETGKTYTVSMDYSVESDYTPYGSGDQQMFGLEVCTQSGSTSNNFSTLLAKITFGVTAKERTRGSATFTATTDTIYLHLDGGYIRDGMENKDFIVSRLKLEEGSVATAYMPPYSDYATAAELKVANDNINLKVSKNDVINQINVSTEGAKIDADRVEINGTAIFSAIKSSADAAYDTKGAAATVQDNLDNLEVGGRNLLPQTQNWGKVSTSNGTGTITSDTKAGCQILKFVWGSGSADVFFTGKWTRPLEANAWYTLSFWARADAAVDLRNYLWSPAVVDEGRNSVGRTTSSSDGAILTPITTSWERYWIAWHVKAGSSLPNNVMIGRLLSAGTVYFAGAKFEKGNKATDWTPAPEDIEASAVKRTQRIWYRKSASGAPATPGTASSNWVTKADDGNDAWTKMHIAINSTHKHIYTCEQYEMANGTVGYTSVLLDNTITVIDGGNIITGSVTANKLNAANINASKTLTVGAMTDAAASSILNSNVVAGGDNLVGKFNYTLVHNTTYDYSTGTLTSLTTTNTANDSVYIQAMTGTTSTSVGTFVRQLANLGNSSNVGQIIHGTFEKTADFTHIKLKFNGNKSDADVFWDISSIPTGTQLTLSCKLDSISSDGKGNGGVLSGINLRAGNAASQWSLAPRDETIGGRNLLLWTANLPKGSDNTVSGKDGIAAWGGTLGQLIETDEGIRLNAAGNSNECIGIPLANNGSVGNNEDVLLTFEARGNITSVGQFFWLQESGSNVGFTKWLNGNQTISLSETSWTKFTTNVKHAQANIRTCTRILIFYGLGSGNNGKWVEIRKGTLKLEKGIKSTDWTPAPEDMATNSSVDQTYVQNLTPYFLTDMTKTSDEYWANITYGRFTRLGDGWAHFEYTNSGSSTVNNYIKPKVLDFLEPGGKYTLLAEFKNVSISKDGGYFYSQQGNDVQVWGDSVYCGFSIQNATIRAMSGGAGTFYRTLTLLTADSKDPSGTVRGSLPKTSFMSINQQVVAGQTISYDLRLSLYADGYTGPYKPYSGDQLYATNSALTGTNESLEGAITDIGELSDQLVGTISEQNKTITDIQKYLNSLRQDLDAEIQSRQQWLNFNSAEGLIIGATGSTFKTVTTNTSQQFRSGGTVLAETSGSEFVAPVMRSDQILIGNWMWTRRDNGNLSLKWIG